MALVTASSGAQLPREGDIVAGKYRVDRVLGAGGMGVVVAAHHLQLDERVALKFLLPSALQNAEVVGRFVREARAAAKIKSEHVARVSDVGELPDGSPYMVMEYLDGADLATMLARSGPLPVDQAVDFVLQACEALAEAHTLGIVHRDLKPANIFFTQKTDGTPCIKVLDFGISKVMKSDGTGSEMTKTTAFLGSPLYMSPEQLQLSKGVDARTDLWSLGVILYELVTGRAPFDANAVTELIINIATQPAPHAKTLRADIPDALDLAIDRCLAKDRAQRFQTVGELAVALQDVASNRGRNSIEGIVGTLQRAGIVTRSSQPPAPPATAPRLSAIPEVAIPAQTSAAWGQTASRSSGGGKAVAVVGLVLVLGMMGLGGFLWLTKAPPPVAASAPPATQEVVTVAPAASSGPAPAAPAAAAADDEPKPAPSVTTAAVASAPPIVAASPLAPPRPTAAPATPTAKPFASAPSPAPAPAHASAKADCSPNYYLDQTGQKHYKPQCFSH